MKYQFEDTRLPCFSVPNRVADGFLNIATGAQLKVLLFLLRFTMPVDAAEIARFCNLKPEEVDDAVQFWCKEKIFVLEQGKLRLVAGTQTVLPRELPRVQPTVILEECSEDFKAMIAEIQRITGKTMNTTMVSLFYMLAENMNFSPEAVVQLAAYCSSIGKFSYRYIETIATDWHDNGINTFELVEQKIRELEDYRKLETRLKRAFGIATNFSAKQKEMIGAWAAMGLSEELMVEAYNRCMDSKGKMSFAYMNTILEKWAKLGYKKAADIRDEVNTGRQQHSGLSELERIAIERMQAGGVK